MRTGMRGVAAAATALWLVLGTAVADVVMLENGSRLVGRLAGLAPGKILWATDFAGILTLEAARVVDIRTEQPVHVAFEDGHQVTGNLAAAEVGAVLQTAAGPLPVVDLKGIKAVWNEGQPDPTQQPPPGRTWTHELSLNVSGKSGNSNTSRVGGSAKSVLAGPRDKTVLTLRGTHAEENEVDTENEVIGGADYERTFLKRQLWYARAEAERDTIEGVDLRLTGAGGYGYYFIRNEIRSLRGRLGLQYRHEDYASGREEDVLAPEFGLRLETPLRTWAKLISEVTYAPAFDEPSNYRLDHTSAVDIPLTASKRLSLRFEVRNTYNSAAEDEVDKLDTVYLARLVLKFP